MPGRSPPTRSGSSLMRWPTISAISCASGDAEPIKDWSLTSLKEKLIKIGAKVVSHGRCVAFRDGRGRHPRQMFEEILRLIAEHGRSHHERQREALDCHAFTSNRREECAQMPGKWPMSPRPSFGLPDALVTVLTSRLSCRKAGNTRIFAPDRESSGGSRFRFKLLGNSAGAPGRGLGFMAELERGARQAPRRRARRRSRRHRQRRSVERFSADPRWPQTPERISPYCKSVLIVLVQRIPAGAFPARPMCRCDHRHAGPAQNGQGRLLAC